MNAHSQSQSFRPAARLGPRGSFAPVLVWLLVAAGSPASANVVMEWNAAATARDEGVSSSLPVVLQARLCTMAQLAIRDAITSATPRGSVAPSQATAIAAAATAAHDLLTSLRPAYAARFSALHARHMAVVANDAARDEGGRIGRQCAASVLAVRLNDGWAAFTDDESVRAAAGELLRVGFQSGANGRKTRAGENLVLFCRKRVRQFKPEPLFFAYGDGVALPNDRLRSPKLIGSPADLMDERPDPREWQADPIAHWNRIARALLAERATDLVGSARVLAALNTALADAALSVAYWNQEYRRGHEEMPVDFSFVSDAVEHGINPAVPLTLDPTVPLTPFRPPTISKPVLGYPALSAALAGAAEAVLKASFGGDVAFTLPVRASAAGALPRTLTLRQAARECSWMPFTEHGASFEACVAGYDLGQKIGSQSLKSARR